MIAINARVPFDGAACDLINRAQVVAMPPETDRRGGETALPIVSRFSIELDECEDARLQGIADELAAQSRNSVAHSFWERVRSGFASGPWLIVGDTREIALAKAGHESTYEYRLSLLARSGDAMLLSAGSHDGFETYRSDVLGAQNVLIIRPRPYKGRPLMPLADRCLSDPDAFAQLVEFARSRNGLTLFPHISTGSSWRLAKAIVQATGVEVRVTAAPSWIARRVNDKLWFARLVARVLGHGALPPTYSAHGPAVLAWRMKALARTAERIVVKVPDSAGSAGNICLRASEVAESKLASVKEHILALLRAVGWRDTYPLLVGLWEAPALSSPSVQMWIPSKATGPPIIEGLFEQILQGKEGTFVGSIPAELPQGWSERMTLEAMQIATVLQHLGYFGRCSFDALLVGFDHSDAKLHWIECNGRWGGVSIPMTIVNRICPTSARSFVVTQRTDLVRQPVGFSKAVRILDEVLLKPGRTDNGVIVLSPVEIEAGTGLQAVACAATTTEALALANRAVDMLGSTYENPNGGSYPASATGKAADAREPEAGKSV